MALDVKVKIDINKPIGKLGYSYPLLLVVESDESPTINDYKECKTLDEVVEAGYATTTNAYKTANLIFHRITPLQRLQLRIVNQQRKLQQLPIVQNTIGDSLLLFARVQQQPQQQQ